MNSLHPCVRARDSRTSCPTSERRAKADRRGHRTLRVRAGFAAALGARSAAGESGGKPMPERTMQGVFPILVTPFDEQSRVDEESLRHLVEFSVGSGVHGLGVALGSEIF